MSTQSIIEHKANMYYLEFREDYLVLSQQCTFIKTNGKPSAHCQALILAVLESLTNYKKSKSKDLHINMTYQQWAESMYGMFGRTTIIDSLDVLIGENLVSKEAHRVLGKDTYRYLLNADEINLRMQALEKRDPFVTRPKINGSKSSDPSEKRRDPSENKRVTRPKKDADPSESGRFLNTTKKQDLNTTYNTDLLLQDQLLQKINLLEEMITALQAKVTEVVVPTALPGSTPAIEQAGSKAEEVITPAAQLTPPPQLVEVVAPPSTLPGMSGVIMTPPLETATPLAAETPRRSGEARMPSQKRTSTQRPAPPQVQAQAQPAQNFTLSGSRMADLYKQVKGRRPSATPKNVAAANSLGVILEDDETITDETVIGVIQTMTNDPFLIEHKVGIDLDFVFRKWDTYLDKWDTEQKAKKQRELFANSTYKDFNGKTVKVSDGKMDPLERMKMYERKFAAKAVK